MEKRKAWHFYLILGVVFLTVYNILPTIFFYSQPLKQPIGPNEASKVAQQIVERVNSLEGFTLSWLKAQSKNLGLTPVSLKLDTENPRLVHVKFKSEKEAEKFSNSLKRSGALIPFVPAQLSPAPRFGEDKTIVSVQRKIGIHLDPSTAKDIFYYVPKRNESGEITPEYRRLVYQRALELAQSFVAKNSEAQLIEQIQNTPDFIRNEGLVRLSRNLADFNTVFKEHPEALKRYFNSIHLTKDKATSVVGNLEEIKGQMQKQLSSLNDQGKELQEKGQVQDGASQQRLTLLKAQIATLDEALTILKRESASLPSKIEPLDEEAILKTLLAENLDSNSLQAIDLQLRHPFVKNISIDLGREQLMLNVHDDVNKLRDLKVTEERVALSQEKLGQLLYNEIAAAGRASEEKISPALNHFVVELNTLTNSSSLLAFDLAKLAAIQADTLKTLLNESWDRSSEDLKGANYPIYTYNEYSKLSAEKQKLGLVVYAPVMEKEPKEGFRTSSLYVIARGMASIRQKYADYPDSPERQAYENELRALQDIMKQSGFIGYAGESSGLPKEFENDYIFELDDYYAYVIAATRENFSVHGDKRYALLEFTNLEERIITLNKIETQIQEELVKWQEEYQQARVAVSEQAHYDVPKPTRSVLLSNIFLSARKYIRGDERKVLKWGLDLSGGKTVRIGLHDQNNKLITNEDDLNQAVNELYQRVNRLGLSEVNIRVEGSSIVLDFPGSQALSASELIQASAMYFHVVNEQFSPQNPSLGSAVSTFLEEVWNEAVITNRTDPQSINEIAWQHLGGSSERPGEFTPLTTHARLLVENGLRIAGPKAPPRSSTFDETLSSVTRFRGEDFSDWQGQTHPLLIVFRNYALEGNQLSDVQTGYSSQEGNTLSFSVKSSFVAPSGERVNPRDQFYSWTSQFSEDRIGGTSKEAFSNGRGWRMAVILNGSVISSPTLNAALRDSARITGHFTQREVNQLAADLKAGSLSFTPKILSEQNVSPDLGKEQRIQGIFAALLGLVFMAAIMCGYYRFAGVVACCAVLFNLFIIWAVLQNLSAALTLPGIAGIILAIGMSVDANVLVFERIREEFAQSRRLPSAVQAGYSKAFTAIFDSNITTIIAALILLNFDAGPVKGLALTLIIGILSSMFTALFVTRYFFSGWVQNPNHKELKMMQLFKNVSFDFLSKSKYFIGVALIVCAVGGFYLVKERMTIFGMDFTGGYALTLDLKESEGTSYRVQAEKALTAQGAYSTDFQIQELNRPNQLRIQLGMGMESPGRPFFELEETTGGDLPYQDNPRIVWIVDALQSEGLQPTEAQAEVLHLNWTEMSGQLSERMRSQALIGLGLALLSILIYITIRFEFKYAVSATIAITHDLLVTLGLIALLHSFVGGVQIDLQVIAALMTIIGYSLNDTIIIFDRIREDSRFQRKLGYSQMINMALNSTLSRTVMTSGTTVAVLLSLVCFGGQTILNFSLVMLLGVIVGTLSSLFIAPPILLYFHQKEFEGAGAIKKT
jgi:SecD/SecF fusion protein